MRLDKFLKVTRLIKRRQIAKEIIEAEIILLNNKFAKPAKEIKQGDIIELRLGRKSIMVRVVKIPVDTKFSPTDLYEIISEKVINPQE